MQTYNGIHSDLFVNRQKYKFIILGDRLFPWFFNLMLKQWKTNGLRFNQLRLTVFKTHEKSKSEMRRWERKKEETEPARKWTFSLLPTAPGSRPLGQGFIRMLGSSAGQRRGQRQSVYPGAASARCSRTDEVTGDRCSCRPQAEASSLQFMNSCWGKTWESKVIWRVPAQLSPGGWRWRRRLDRHKPSSTKASDGVQAPAACVDSSESLDVLNDEPSQHVPSRCQAADHVTASGFVWHNDSWTFNSKWPGFSTRSKLRIRFDFIMCDRTIFHPQSKRLTQCCYVIRTKL